MEQQGYNLEERLNNVDFFNNNILPELKSMYKRQLLNVSSQQNRFKNGKNIVDYYPHRKRLCHVNTNQWFTVDEDEFIMSRIIFLLNRK
ncbi:MAG: hypothetical protein ACOVJ5_01505 [Gloeomargaritales cyanobacterium]|jgi:hypothetical protein